MTEDQHSDPILDHHVIATTREGRRIPIWDSQHNRDTFTKEEAFATAERYAAKVQEYTYAAVSIVEHAWSDLVALTTETIAKLDVDGAEELDVRRMFDGGDIQEGGDGQAQFMEIDGAHEAMAKARAVPSPEHEAKVRDLVDGAIVRAEIRDAEKAAAEAAAAEAKRIADEEAAYAKAAAEEEARLAALAAAEPVETAETEAAGIAQAETNAANAPEAELDAIATENAGSGGGHGDSAGGEMAAKTAEDGEAHATTEPPPTGDGGDGGTPATDATPATDGGDDKPPPTE